MASSYDITMNFINLRDRKNNHAVNAINILMCLVVATLLFQLLA